MKVIILGLVLSFMIIPLSYASTVGLWTFDELGGSIAYDSSGYGNDGVIYGATRTTDTPFAYTGNGAMSFDGLNDYINAGAGSSLNLTNAFTAEAWIKPRQGDRRYIMDKNHIYAIALESQYLVTGIRKSGEYFGLYADSPIALNSWSHIASVYNGTDLKIFVNGELRGEVTPIISGGGSDPSLNPSENFIIGNHCLINYPLGGYYFDGLIDEVRISDIALSSEQLGYGRSFGAATPEPATISLLGLGLLGLVFRRKK